MKRHTLKTLGSLLVAAGLCSPALSQVDPAVAKLKPKDFPSQSIEYTVVYPAGGGMDVTARLLAILLFCDYLRGPVAEPVEALVGHFDRAEAEHWPDEDRSKRKRAIPIQYFGAMNDQGRCGWRMRHRRNRRHSRDRPGTTPSHQRHKRGLDLIIGGMAGHDCCRARRQCQVCEELVSPLTS